MLKKVVNAYIYEDEDFLTPISGKIAPINKAYIPQTNGEISHSIMQNWTVQAVECYRIDSQCANCSLNGGNYSFICQMPKIVKALLKAYGPPQKNLSE